jgi:hypothetical protein
MIELTVIVVVLLLVGFVVWHLAYTQYKDREWRRNNPDEHEIMNRKIKDDFSDE